MADRVMYFLQLAQHMPDEHAAFYTHASLVCPFEVPYTVAWYVQTLLSPDTVPSAYTRALVLEFLGYGWTCADEYAHLRAEITRHLDVT